MCRGYWVVRVVLLACCLIFYFSPLHASWTDPVYGFSLDVPKDWRMDENNSVQSRNLVLLNSDNSIAVGVISVNAGRPLTLEQWMQIIEPMFLGDILPNGKRSSMEPRQQNGLNGIYAAYQGNYRSGTAKLQANARIFYLMRGNVGHIVWCVVPDDSMASHLHLAEKVVSSFSFSPKATTNRRAAVSNQSVANNVAQKQHQSVPYTSTYPTVNRGYSRDKQAVELRNRYTRQGAGYEIRYPNAWTVSSTDDHTVSIKPVGGIAANGSPVITIQNFAHTQHGGSYSNLAAVVSGAREYLSKVGEVKIERDRPFHLQGPEGRLKGVELVASYNLDNKPVHQQIIVLARQRDQGFHLWSYTAGKDLFNNNKPTIDAMLSSWKIFH